MDFILIGAGLPRTGTLSTMHALEIILPGKCNHMKKAVHFQDMWADILAGRVTDEEFRQFFLSNNEVAGVDWPFCFVYEQAMRVFPNAKVLLTVREPKTWVKSIKETIYKRRYFDPSIIFKKLRLFPTYLSYFTADGGPDKRKWTWDLFRELEKVGKMGEAVRGGNGEEYYKKWVRKVEETVPEEKLLKFHVKEGWEPLCRFLNVPVPDVPFPRVNSTAEFENRVSLVCRKSWLLLYEIVSLPTWIYVIYRLTYV